MWAVISTRSSRYLYRPIFFSLLFFFFFFLLKSSSFFQVLGESLHITCEYLAQETKVVFAVLRVEALEAKNSKLKKDLIIAMGEANAMKEKLKVIGDDLRAERQLMVGKDEQLLRLRRKLRPLLLRPFKPSNRLTSLTLYSLVGTLRDSISLGTTSSSTQLAWTWRILTSRRLTERWLQTRLPSLQHWKVMPLRLLLRPQLMMTSLTTHEPITCKKFLLFWVPVMFLGLFNSNFRTIFFSIYFKDNVFGPVFMGL